MEKIEKKPYDVISDHFRFDKNAMRTKIKHNKFICKKCKCQLLVEFEKNENTNSENGRKNILLMKHSESPMKNSVYKNPDLIKEVQENSLEMLEEYISENPVKKFKAKIKRDNKMYNMFRILKKILFNNLPTKTEMEKISPLEEQLLLLIIKKKKFYQYEKANISLEYFKKMIKNPNTKRPEENMKIVIKSSFKTLKHFFKELCYKKLKSHMFDQYYKNSVLSSSEYAFYGYYFGETSVKINQEIEKFFCPRKIVDSSNSSAKLISKTISKLYLNFIGLSKPFVHDLIYFLDNCFLNEFKAKLLMKIQNLCLNWSKILENQSPEYLLLEIQKMFQKNPKIKLFWTIGEITSAIKEVKDILNLSKINS
jgi:hypothetical protein